MAMAGLGASLILAALTYFSKQVKPLRYVALTLAGVSAGFASFLGASQILLGKRYCYLCLASSIGFYLIFVALLFHLVIRPAWSNYK